MHVISLFSAAVSARTFIAGFGVHGLQQGGWNHGPTVHPHRNTATSNSGDPFVVQCSPPASHTPSNQFNEASSTNPAVPITIALIHLTPQPMTQVCTPSYRQDTMPLSLRVPPLLIPMSKQPVYSSRESLKTDSNLSSSSAVTWAGLPWG